MESKLGNAYYTDQTTITAGGHSSSGISSFARMTFIYPCIKDGKTIDPCCGSAGMFVSSIKFVERHNGNCSRISVVGQERNPDTWWLAKMNLAIRGIAHKLGERPESTFAEDLHKGKSGFHHGESSGQPETERPGHKAK